MTKQLTDKAECEHKWHKMASGFFGFGGSLFKCLKCGMEVTTDNCFDQCP